MFQPEVRTETQQQNRMISLRLMVNSFQVERCAKNKIEFHQKNTQYVHKVFHSQASVN